MKKLLVVLLIVMVGMVTWLVWPGTIREAEFVGIKNLEIKQTSTYEAEVRGTVVFFNSNKLDATLLNSDLKVSTKGLRIASISQTDIIGIQEMSPFEVPLVCKVDMMQIAYSQGLSSLVEMALNQDREIPIEVDGYCRIKVKDEVQRIPVRFRDKIRFK